MASGLAVGPVTTAACPTSQLERQRCEYSEYHTLGQDPYRRRPVRGLKYIGGEQKGDDFNSAAPRHLFKLATDYRLPGALNHMRVGGSFYAQSTMVQREYGEAYKIRQDAYHLTSLHAVYEVNKNLELQYNLDNVLDKQYYQTLGNPDYWNF